MGRGKPFESFYVVAESGCWEWTGFRNQSGYGRYKKQGAHRFSYERSKGPIPPGMFVCHACDNPCCVNPDHLWLGTPRDNNRDMHAKGRRSPLCGAQPGAKNPFAKLDAAAVGRIKALHGKVTARSLAERYGVARSTIAMVQTGKTWS